MSEKQQAEAVRLLAEWLQRATWHEPPPNVGQPGGPLPMTELIERTKKILRTDADVTPVESHGQRRG